MTTNAGSTEPTQSNDEQPVKVPRWFLVAALSAALGSVGTGGATTLLHGAGPDVASLKEQITLMQAQLVQINASVLEVRNDLKNDAAAQGNVQTTLALHEQRLQALEKKGR